MTQPTALYLADVLEHAGVPADLAGSVCSELRRLHAQCEALLEALKNIERSTYDTMTAALARVAIAKAEESI